MSDYLFAELSKKNCFNIKIKCYFGDSKIITSAKIDTGACKSLLPLRSVGYSESKCKEIKNILIASDMEKSFSRGIECCEINKEDLQNCRALAFKCVVKELQLGDYSAVHDNTFSVNCDFTCSILIGMDILQNFDFHIGLSNVTGKTVFIGCLRSNITNEYLSALKLHFNLVPNERNISRLFRGLFT